MKNVLMTVFLMLIAAPAFSAGNGGFKLYSAKVDLGDKVSLQRGAKYFVNYCMGCHALSHLRYNRLGRDLGLTDRQVEENLIFTRDEEGSPTRVGELMTIAMDKFYADKSFGVVPPDLTLTARSRTPDWIYTYLLTFYNDSSKQWGVNNAVFPNAGMPNVLWELQGEQKPIYQEFTDSHGTTHQRITGFEQVKPGSMNPEEFAQVALDLTNFMTYAAEPAKLVRYKIGAWVMAFLLIFAVASYALKKEYWRDIK